MRVLVSDYNATINVTNIYGLTALHQAAALGNVAVVTTLLSFKHCDVNARSSSAGWTALHHACNNGHVSCINELMAAGCDVAATTDDNDTLLHLSAQSNHTACVATLVEVYVAPINAVNSHGKTALYTAASQGNTDVVRLLTSYEDCDVNIRDHDGRTAADDARRNGHHAIVALLEAKSKGDVKRCCRAAVSAIMSIHCNCIIFQRSNCVCVRGRPFENTRQPTMKIGQINRDAKAGPYHQEF